MVLPGVHIPEQKRGWSLKKSRRSSCTPQPHPETGVVSTDVETSAEDRAKIRSQESSQSTEKSLTQDSYFLKVHFIIQLSLHHRLPLCHLNRIEWTSILDLEPSLLKASGDSETQPTMTHLKVTYLPVLMV